MSAPRSKQGINQIKPHMLIHNNDPGTVASIILNSNESAFGPSVNAQKAARCAISNIERYCENPAQILVPAIAKRFNLNKDYIAIGPGSDDLLARLARAFLEPGSELIRSRNGYLKVPNYAHANDAIPIHAQDKHFTAQVGSLLENVTKQTRIVYLANPDNPSGTYLSYKEIENLHSQLPAHVLLIIDCAYEDYVNDKNYTATQVLVEKNANVVMTRTFSKIFGLAGARIGWIYAHPDIIDVVNRIGLTFPLASPSLAAAISALEDTVHTNYVYESNCRLRRQLSQALNDKGLTVYPSQANFVLVEFPDSNHTAAEAYNHLNRHGISTRRFASPAFNNCIRITIGLAHEIKQAENSLVEFLAQ